ncbi:MAG TPA: hypothetical protein VLB12_18235 [Gemmatimonadales bacterium]|nr:hypothetical protein [Gemmatimonadales bacterium]
MNGIRVAEGKTSKDSDMLRWAIVGTSVCLLLLFGWSTSNAQERPVTLTVHGWMGRKPPVKEALTPGPAASATDPLVEPFQRAAPDEQVMSFLSTGVIHNTAKQIESLQTEILTRMVALSSRGGGVLNIEAHSGVGSSPIEL